MRQSQSGTAGEHSKVNKLAYAYKDSDDAQGVSTLHLRFRRLVVVSVGIMVSAWFIAKALVAFAPLTSVVAQYAETSQFPNLLDATVEELTVGLEKGDFTSVELVQVSNAYFPHSESEASEKKGSYVNRKMK